MAEASDKKKDHDCMKYICERYMFDWHCLICIPEDIAHNIPIERITV